MYNKEIYDISIKEFLLKKVGIKLFPKDKEAIYLDLATYLCTFTLKGYSCMCQDLGSARQLDLATSQYIFILEGYSSLVILITWSLDGSRLDLVTGKYLLALNGYSDLIEADSHRCRIIALSRSRIWLLASVISIAWSLDGSRLVLVLDDNTIRVWDSATGQCIFTFNICFNKTIPNHLHINISILNLGSTNPVMSSPGSLTLPGRYRYSLGDGVLWITYNGFNLLWLPTEYRPSKRSLFAISATTVAIGYSSGCVIFLALSEQSISVV
ncbi:hypothetical protein N7488_012321 [Penicillium malachiteum]|nr:hypothetical protein N7488_012321 [Penicillium malachiteum]